MNKRIQNTITDVKNTVKRHRGGFTLIELLVVVLIIGILSAIALPQYQRSVEKSHFSEAFINLKNLKEAQRLCRLERGGNSTECNSFENLSVTLSGEMDKTGYAVDTKNFRYVLTGTGDIDSPTAWYKKYDVVICLDDSGEFVGSNDGSACEDQTTPYDVIKMLGLKNVGSSCWQC